MQVANILKEVEHWTTHAMYQIDSAWKQKGGWEGWAQVEIALAFTEKDSDVGEHYEVTREGYPYGGLHRADIILTPKDAQYRTEVIELKCQSENRTEYGFTYVVEEDVNWIISKYKSAKTPTRFWALAITMTKSMRDEVVKMMVKKGLKCEQRQIANTDTYLLYWTILGGVRA